jgi:peptidoglycan/LPS O-acetylase OafA/YrhL
MKMIAWTLMIALAAILISASICQPYLLSDEGSEFFREFVNHEMLSVLGVIVTITLASAANMHLELNKLQERTGEAFPEARRAIKMSCYSLVAIFGVAFAVVIAKSWVADSQHGTALINSLVVLMFVFSLAILADLTAAIFRIPVITRRATEAGTRDDR